MAKAWTFENTRSGYGELWRSIAVKPSDLSGTSRFARKIIEGEARYREVSGKTGVPWYFIGALHMRESSCNFAGVLHNGEKIIGTGRKTRLVPAGRGPFTSWSEAAVDALKLKGLHKIKSWPIEMMGFQAELFNGLGYARKGINSPYLWAGSNHERPGKYVADHVFDPTANDSQIGVMTVLKRLCELRPDIEKEINSKFVPPPPDVPKPDDKPKDKQPWYKRLWAKLAGIGLGTGITVGGVTIDHRMIYAICALLVVGALVWWFVKHFIKPKV